MKILYISSDLGIPVLGRKGAAVHVRALVSAMVRAGHEVVLTAPILNKSPWEEPASLDGSLLHIPPSDATKDVALVLRNYDESLDGVAASLPGEVRRILYNEELTKRLVRRFDSHPPDFIYERVSLYGTAGAKLAAALHRPLIVELNAPLTTEQAAYRGTGIAALAAQAERYTLKQAHAVIVVSEALRAHVVSLGVAEDRVHVLPNGVDTRVFHPNGSGPTVHKKWRHDNGPVLGFVGGLRPWHGIEVLPELLARLRDEYPNIRLAVIGDGPLRGQLQQQLAERHLDGNAIVTGLLPHEEVPNAIRSFDIALAPYPRLDHAFYFSPLKLFEYMACGVPVVAPKVGQISEILRDGETGLLYPTGDVDALTESCRRLLADAPLRERLGKAGAQLVHKQYTWDGNARKVLDMVAHLGASS